MIANKMREYNYYTLGEDDSYGQPQETLIPGGKVKMSINLSSQATNSNILYADCEYLGLTHNANVDDTYIIEYGNERLKVKYINPHTRYIQVFMSRMS